MIDVEPYDAGEHSSKDVRVIVRVKNANILREMERRGITSVAELSRLSGISQINIGMLVNMKKTAVRVRDKGWCTAAEDLATFFKCLPEDLFSWFQQNNVAGQTAARDVSSDDIMMLLEPGSQKTPEEIMMSKETEHAVSLMLSKLTPREERVLRLRFGIGADTDHTLDEVGEKILVSRERVRQIETRAIRRLKHPSRLTKHDAREMLNNLTNEDHE